jgi:hypothetical protein
MVRGSPNLDLLCKYEALIKQVVDDNLKDKECNLRDGLLTKPVLLAFLAQIEKTLKEFNSMFNSDEGIELTLELFRDFAQKGKRSTRLSEEVYGRIEAMCGVIDVLC